MTDIRQSTAIKDDFTRVEDPLSFGGKWSLVDSAFTTLKANGTVATTSGGGGAYGWSYWNVENYDGDEAECWGCRVGTSGPTLANDLLLVKDVGGSSAVDGYLFRVGTTTGGTYTELYKLTNAGGGSPIAGNIFGPFIGHPQMCLIRRNGGAVEGWTTHDSGATWDLRVTANDSTYTTDLYAGLGIFGNSAGWSCFGSGPRIPNKPQFIRRPWRYQGVPLRL